MNEGRHRRKPAGGAVALDDSSGPAKVFCIGFNKTGTTTLHRLFAEQLGYRSTHNPEWTDWSIARPKDAFDRHDVYSDGGCASIRNLDELFPNARFILNTRPLMHWVLSRHKAVERSRTAARWALTKYVPLGFLSSLLDRWVLQNQDPAMLRWIAVRNSFHRYVVQYFSARTGKLLVLDIEDEAAMEHLSDFLGVSRGLQASTANAEGQGSTTTIILDAIGAKIARNRSELAVTALFENHGLALHSDCLTWFESDVHRVGRSGSDQLLRVLPFLRPCIRAAYVRLVGVRSRARSFLAKWIVDTLIRFFRSEEDLDHFTTVRRLASASQ